MRIGVLGTGGVGQALGAKLVELGHEVMLGSRTSDNERAAEWVERTGAGASQGTFGDAAAFGELVVNCTAGSASVEAIQSVREEHLAGKTLVDVANPLELVDGELHVHASTAESLAERIQRAVPGARVVKTLNTVNHQVMVDPSRVPGESDVFVCGGDDAAKAEVVELLRSFGWQTIHDLGDLSAARALELYLPLWLRLRALTGTADVNIRVVA